MAEPRKHRSLSEWVATFFQEDGLAYDEEYYADDIFDGTMGNGEAGNEDDSAMESLLIIAITLALGFLLYYRQRIQQAHQEAEEARRREQGLPPRQQPENALPEGIDPFQAWAGGPLGL